MPEFIQNVAAKILAYTQRWVGPRGVLSATVGGWAVYPDALKESMNKVVIRQEASGVSDRSSTAGVPASERRGWVVLGWAGALFVLVAGLDLALAWYPLNFGNPEWEFGTVTTILSNLPLFVMGWVLLLSAGLAQGKQWLVRGVALILAVVGIATLGMALLYATNIPIALQSVPEGTVVQLGLKKAIVRTMGQAVLYSLSFFVISFFGWRLSPRR